MCSMKAAHHNLNRVQTEVHRMTMHCGYLFLVMWAELAAGMVLPTKTTDPNMQSVISDLQKALQSYSSILKEKSNLADLSMLQCTETTAHLKQPSTVSSKLSGYQDCAKQTGSFNHEVNVAFCGVIKLNSDLLQHLGSFQFSAECPPSSPASSLPDFISLKKSIECVDCWRKQVEALRR